MNMTTKPKAALLKQASPSEEKTTDGYDCYICISSDSLLVLDKQLGLVEWIIQGQDNSAIYLSAESEDDFLDAISLFKKMILAGLNPKEADLYIP